MEVECFESEHEAAMRHFNLNLKKKVSNTVSNLNIVELALIFYLDHLKEVLLVDIVQVPRVYKPA